MSEKEKIGDVEIKRLPQGCYHKWSARCEKCCLRRLFISQQEAGNWSGSHICESKPVSDTKLFEEETKIF